MKKKKKDSSEVLWRLAEVRMEPAYKGGTNLDRRRKSISISTSLEVTGASWNITDVL
jgi:hypothetical protein